MVGKDNNPTLVDRIAEFERALKENERKTFVLRLYIAGLSSRSQRAVADVKRVCEEHLKGRYELEVIDVYQKPNLAADEQIIAVPTLLKLFPLPLRRIIGELSDQEKVLFGLDLREKE